MDLSRYFDLYLAETEENLRALSGALLALEAGEGKGALEAAFRAAHTIKGVAAAMGFETVAAEAHRLEDMLTEVRSGRRPADPAWVDAMLAVADALEAAVAESVERGPSAEALEESEGPAEPFDAGAGADLEADAVAGFAEDAELVAAVILSKDTPLRAARAAVIRRRLSELVPVLGSWPPDPSEHVNRPLLVFLGRDGDRAALEAAVRGAGDVERVEFIVPMRYSRPAGPATGPKPKQPARPDRDAEAGRAHGRTVRVDAGRLDEISDGIAELAVVAGRLVAQLSPEVPAALAETARRIARQVEEIQAAALALRMVPVREVFDRLPRVVRDAARALDKEVDFRIEGQDVELDRAILEELTDPLVHLLRNAVAHGLEEPEERLATGKPVRGLLRLSAVRDRSSVRIVVEDDGRGIDPERVRRRARELGIDVPPGTELTGEALLRVIGRPGFSTAEKVTEVSGRGVGLDAVLERVRALGGAVAMETKPGVGTSFQLTLPVTLAVTHALRVQVAGEDYVLPLTHVTEAIDLRDARVTRTEGGEFVDVRGEPLPLVRLGQVRAADGAGEESAAVITAMGERRGALAVDRLVGRERILVKGFDAAAGTLPIFSGATLLGDGRPALVLDPTSVL